MDRGHLSFQVHVLVVDSDPRRRKLLAAGLDHAGYNTTQATTVEEAWEQLTKEIFQVVIAQSALPDADGWEFLEEVAEDFPHIRRMLVSDDVSELPTNDDAARGSFVPPHRVEAGVRLARELINTDRERRRHERVEDDVLLKVLRQALAYNETVTRTGSPVVAAFVERLARAIEISDERIEELQRVAALHDIGQIGVNEQLLTKSTPLSRAERLQVQTHAATGYQILRQFSFLRDCAQIALFHHERYDGSGYPLGLSGDTIPLEARILAVADAFASMTSRRPHRAALSFEDARQQIAEGSGTQFDPLVVSAFLQIPTKEWQDLATRVLSGSTPAHSQSSESPVPAASVS